MQKLIDRAEKIRFEQTHRIEKEIFMNTCMVYDDNNGSNIVARNVPGRYVYDNRKVFEFEVRL